ncbi:hypothetical protein BRC91_10440 [Halobacteriales archaeon QS_4_62_28]|nr:MAG: hypothetical protein BRC91_10440 [Halobacteriales archaeon QS_4_62_28]
MSGDELDDPDSGPEIPEAPAPDGPDPESLGPEVPTAPGTETLGPEIPTPPDPGEGDSEVVGLFWKLVVVFNVAILGLSVGPMIVFFLGDWDLGLQVFAVGALAFAYGTARYYQFRRDRDGDTDTD